MKQTKIQTDRQTRRFAVPLFKLSQKHEIDSYLLLSLMSHLDLKYQRSAQHAISSTQSL